MPRFSVGDCVLKTQGIARGFEGIVISNSYAGPLVKFLGWSGGHDGGMKTEEKCYWTCSEDYLVIVDAFEGNT